MGIFSHWTVEKGVNVFTNNLFLIFLKVRGDATGGYSLLSNMSYIEISGKKLLSS